MAKKASQTPEEQMRTQMILLEIVTCIGPIMTEQACEAANIQPQLAAWHLRRLAVAGKIESRPRRLGRNKVRMEWVATPGRAAEPPKRQNPNKGIDQSDLEWMAKYRAQHQDRRKRLESAK